MAPPAAEGIRRSRRGVSPSERGEGSSAGAGVAGLVSPPARSRSRSVSQQRSAANETVHGSAADGDGQGNGYGIHDDDDDDESRIGRPRVVKREVCSCAIRASWEKCVHSMLCQLSNTRTLFAFQYEPRHHWEHPPHAQAQCLDVCCLNRAGHTHTAMKCSVRSTGSSIPLHAPAAELT